MIALVSLAFYAGRHACAQRVVFAHYMVTNQDYQADDSSGERKISAYEKEIRQAQEVGIDGFALNVGGWSRQDYYVRYSSEMFEAAYRVHSGFKLMFSADMCCGNSAADVEDMVRRFANNPRYRSVYYQRSGKFVLSTFAGEKRGEAFWLRVKNDLTSGSNPSTYNNTTALSTATGVSSNAALPVFFIPAFFWGGEIPATSEIQGGYETFSKVIDGAFYWGIAGVPGQGSAVDQISSNESYAAVLHNAGRQYMAPVTLQFWGANAGRYYEYSGYRGMRKMWLYAINITKADLVELITWNDFIEGTYLSPIDDPNRYENANYLGHDGLPNSITGYFHSHAGATDILKYYIQWYKTGTQPLISTDTIYWAYRTQSSATTSANNSPQVGRQYGPVADVIYISAFLTSPARLKVIAGNGVQTLELKPGYNEVTVPFTPSNEKPTFELDRGSMTILAATGKDKIQSTPQYNNFYYSTGDCATSANANVKRSSTALCYRR